MKSIRPRIVTRLCGTQGPAAACQRPSRQQHPSLQTRRRQHDQAQTLGNSSSRPFGVKIDDPTTVTSRRRNTRRPLEDGLRISRFVSGDPDAPGGFTVDSAGDIPPEFYTWICDARSFPEPRPAEEWLKVLDYDQLIAKLPEEYRDSPLSILDQQDADVETVISCLEAFIAQTHSPGKSLPFIRGIFSNFNAGRRALFWIHQNQGRIGLNDDTSLTRAIVHCLVAAEHTDDILRWYSEDHSTMSRVDRYRWRTSTMAFTVESSYFWDTIPLNGALKAFLRFVHEKWNHVSSLSERKVAGAFILKRLLVGHTKEVDPELFDRFSADVGKMCNQTRGEAVFHKARLIAIHPTRPQPSARIQFLKDHAIPGNQSPYVTRLLKDNPLVFWMFLRETATLLWQARLRGQSQWVIEFGRTIVPEKFKKTLAAYYAFPGTKVIAGSVNTAPSEEQATLNTKDARDRWRRV